MFYKNNVLEDGFIDHLPLRNNNEYYDFKETFYIELLNLAPIVKEALKHRTVDTYARKLFLQNEEVKLNGLKRFLSIYFAFEQSDSLKKIMLTGPNFEMLKRDKAELQKITNHIKTTLDYRYDVFFASVLDGSSKLPQNINIISWNYDHQLELAFRDFSRKDLHKCQDILEVFPRKNTKTGKVIKLNGSAHQYYGKDGNINFFDSSPNDIYKSILTSFEDETFLQNEFALNFAWEKGPNQLKAIELAEGILSNTDELIIIGYSFPYFNRDVDIQLLMKTLRNVKRIKVMVHPDDFDSVKQSIQDIIGEYAGSIVPELHEDLDQFYIPSKFFGGTLEL